MAKNELTKVTATEDAKREIKIIAANEKRHEYEVLTDMLKVYKMVAYSKPIKSKKAQPAVDVVASH